MWRTCHNHLLPPCQTTENGSLYKVSFRWHKISKGTNPSSVLFWKGKPFMVTSRFKFSALLLSGLLITTSAQAAQTLLGPSDAGRVQERTKNAPKLGEPESKVDVKAAPNVEAPKGADKIKLTLNAINFEGVTAYAPAELQSLYADKIGQKISLADVYGIANAATVKYRNDGYILTQVIVPPQTIDGGKVKLQVVEGFINTISIDGVTKDSERNLISAYADRAKRSQPLNVRDLEQALLMINDLPGVSARSILSPSPNKVGAADLKIIIERDMFDSQVGVDNFGSRYLGRLEGSGAVAANSMLGMNERISAQAVYAPSSSLNKELLYGDLGYSQPVGTLGTKLDLLGSITSTVPGYTLREFDVRGRSVFWSAKLSQPIIRTRNLNWSVYGLFDWRNVQTDTNIETTRVDHIRMLRAGTSFDALDSFLGAGYNSLNIEIAHGLDVLNSSDKGDANMSRAFGDPDATKMEAEYQRLQRLSSKTNLLFGVKGQSASDAMLSSEEFGVGGASYGRGYDPSEIVGDNGLAGKLELQWNNPVAMPKVETYQLYGFVDAGRVWNTDATNRADKKLTLVSAGVGVRTTLHTKTQADLFVASPLSREVQANQDRDPRVYFTLTQPF
jgi:hemolysin activation/secretion protein